MQKDEKKYYKVICKCGHVGKQNYVPVQFAVMAESGKEAAKMARLFPRVKHNHKDAILNVIEITYEQYLELVTINKNDPYLLCHSRHEQNEICDLSERIVKDMHNVKIKVNKEIRRARVEYIQKKNKYIEKASWEKKYEYAY